MAKKKERGRPSKYKPEYCQEIIKYFDVPFFEDKLVSTTTGKNDFSKDEYKEIATPPRFLSAFARSIGVNTDSLHEWAKVHKDFSVALKCAKEIQHEHFVTCGLKGLFNASAYIFSMKNMHDWRDQTEVKHSGEIEEKRSLIIQLHDSATNFAKKRAKRPTV